MATPQPQALSRHSSTQFAGTLIQERAHYFQCTDVSCLYTVPRGLFWLAVTLNRNGGDGNVGRVLGRPVNRVRKRSWVHWSSFPVFSRRALLTLFIRPPIAT